ncbi:hypothetical protein NIES4071_15490 [Calothrix sp. NIES-4071]|nr:hypothetical protein NIES4071_15490 [Calothrix sp. NIES-4071]BAZ55886.1 hypothetical protein NIES4105_15440 [Calothrix sp. NIES-4105]
MNEPTYLTDTDWLDWQSIGDDSTELAPEQIQRAAQLSLAITSPEQSWQIYLNALGTIGFEEWMAERTPDLDVIISESSIWQVAYSNILAAACNIQVGAFKVCVITANKVGDLQSIPFAVLDVPKLAAHFYVLMHVEEEQQKTNVFGFISYPQFQSYKQQASLQVEEDWTYALPNEQLNFDTDALLLNLRCLDASAINLPDVQCNIPAVQTDTSLALQQKLTGLQSELRKHPSQFLTVEEAKTLLTNSDLINWLYARATTEVVTNASNSQIAQPVQSIQSFINVGLWLRNQIDTVASELGWMLMPTFAPSPLRRSEDFKPIREALKKQGIDIPSHAQGAERDLNSECAALRLYAIIWELDEVSENPEWMMLIVVRSISSYLVPKSLRLEIRDKTQQLFNETLEGDSSKEILFARLIGDSNDRFWVTVTADETSVFEIPPLGIEE